MVEQSCAFQKDAFQNDAFQVRTKLPRAAGRPIIIKKRKTLWQEDEEVILLMIENKML